MVYDRVVSGPKESLKKKKKKKERKEKNHYG